MTDPATNEAFTQPHAIPGDRCLRCGQPVTSLGIERFRIGGTSGGWKLLFGEFAEVGEEMIDLEIYACRTCRHVEFRLPPDAG
jgi:hypothetical protein